MPALMPAPAPGPALTGRPISTAALLARRRGALVALGPAAVLLLSWLHGRPDAGVAAGRTAWWPTAVVALAALYTLGAWTSQVGAARGRWLMTLSALGLAVLAAPALLSSPFLTLSLLLAVGTLLVWLWAPSRAAADPHATALHAESLQGAAIAMVIVWFCAVPGGFAHDEMGWGGAFGAAGVCLILAGHWVGALGLHHRTLAHGFRAAGLLFSGLAAIAWFYWAEKSLALTLAAVPGVAGAVAARRLAATSHLTEDTEWWESLVEDPARTLVVTFLMLSVVGGVLLALPITSNGTHGVMTIDAAFTSVSATCVTGLTVLSTGNDFNLVGQAIVLGLIQIGGLGIMTFSTAAFAVMGRRLSLRHEASMVELLSAEDRGRLQGALKKVLVVTFATEAVGAVLLTPLLIYQGKSFGAALWEAVFTSVSAVCNAGFGLQNDSLVSYQHNAAILHVIAALVVVGGLGPAVVWALPDLARHRRTSLHVKLVLLATGVLLIAPTVFFAVVEWSNALSGLDFVDRLSNAWFQSVTPRTAGFNSIDLTHLRPASVTAMLVLMFIGGSPASTAGGIKVTTVALLLLAVFAALRGRAKATIFGFTIAQTSIYKAAAVATLGVLSVFGAFTALQLTQGISFEVALFEVVSALGTVGLTIGGTQQLDSVGKIIVMLCMFMGRVGPLTLFILLTRSRGVRGEWERPIREVAVG